MDQTNAYKAGLSDGLAWDLSDFGSWEDVERSREGWDAATINALGSDACARRWGVRAEGPEWECACGDYNRGAYEGATAREGRTGPPPGGSS